MSENIASEEHSAEDYALMLRLADIVRGPAVRAIMEWLRLTKGSRGLDAGCGIGRHTRWLAEVVAPGGSVTGIDVSPEFIAIARESAQEAGLSGSVTFQEADVTSLPFEDHIFDWVWTMDVLWPGSGMIDCPPNQPSSLVKKLARVVKPGGTVALVYWSAQKLLPGYPMLEARLNATSPPNAPFKEGMSPNMHALKALGWLKEAGLREVTANTFATGVYAPLSAEVREVMAAILQMFWGKAEPEVSAADWAEFQRICDPDSADCILNQPDYFAFLTYSVFKGVAPG